MRFPKHHSITTTSGERVLIADLGLGVGSSGWFNECPVDGCWGKGWVKRLDEDEKLYLFGHVDVQFFGQLYQKRSGPPVRVY